MDLITRLMPNFLLWRTTGNKSSYGFENSPAEISSHMNALKLECMGQAETGGTY